MNVRFAAQCEAIGRHPRCLDTKVEISMRPTAIDRVGLLPGPWFAVQ